MKIVGPDSLEILIGNFKFVKCIKSPQTELKESVIKRIIHFLGQSVPNVYPFRNTISIFNILYIFRIFPLTPMLKFQSATKLVKLGADCQEK